MRLMAMDGINLPAKSLLGFEHQSQLEPFSRLFFCCFVFQHIRYENISQTRMENVL